MPTHPASPEPSRIGIDGEEARADEIHSTEAVCPSCGGSGRLDGVPCPECNGTGRAGAIVRDA